MARPATVPTYATYNTYPSDGGPDAGLPTKVDPGGSYSSQGERRDDIYIAQYHNFWANLVGQWVDYLRDIQVQNWQSFVGPNVSSTSITHLFENASRNRIYGFAYNALAKAAWTNVGELSTDWTPLTLDGTIAVLWGAANPAGTIVLGGTAAGVASMQNATDGATFTTRNLPGGFSGSPCGLWDPTNSLWIAAGTGPGQIATSPDGTTWTSHTVSGSASSTTFTWCATDGNGKTIFGGNSFNAATATDGVTWTSLTLPAPTFIKVVWNSARSLWMGVGSGGAVAITPNLSSWTAMSTVSYNFLDLAASGGLYVGITNLAGVTGPAHGVAYSTDDGQTWHKIALRSSNLVETFAMKSLGFFRNAFWAVGTNTAPVSAIYRSFRAGPEALNTSG